MNFCLKWGFLFFFLVGIKIAQSARDVGVFSPSHLAVCVSSEFKWFFFLFSPADFAFTYQGKRHDVETVPTLKRNATITSAVCCGRSYLWEVCAARLISTNSQNVCVRGEWPARAGGGPFGVFARAPHPREVTTRGRHVIRPLAPDYSVRLLLVFFFIYLFFCVSFSFVCFVLPQ